jgi:two-component system chemotaxis response regulator CheY
MDVSGLDVGKCVEASNGKEALEMLHSQWIDIILTDVNMPVMNGEEFVSRLAQDEVLRTIPVLVVSTDGSENRVQRMMSLGAKAYVKKPFSPEQLRSTMEKLLGVETAQ